MSLTPKQVANLAQVNVETIRYYEERLLLPKPPRSPPGYRQYSSETVSRIRFIKRSQELGFSLKEISDLLSLRVEPKRRCGEMKRRTQQKITEIERKIHELERIKKALSLLADECRPTSPTTRCPIIEYLEKEER